MPIFTANLIAKKPYIISVCQFSRQTLSLSYTPLPTFNFILTRSQKLHATLHGQLHCKKKSHVIIMKHYTISLNVLNQRPGIHAFFDQFHCNQKPKMFLLQGRPKFLTIDWVLLLMWTYHVYAAVFIYHCLNNVLYKSGILYFTLEYSLTRIFAIFD